MPAAIDTVAFVAEGRGWSMSPDGRNLRCLFEVKGAGPFMWGPLGDRVLVADLEVRGLRGALTHAGGTVEPLHAAWGHPTGKSIVYLPPDGRSLQKLHLDLSSIEDVSPLPNATYLSVEYHPSGLAFAFAVKQKGKESIWISSNTGKEPKRLVFSEEGTTFGTLAFRSDGKVLFYAAQHADGHPELHMITLTDTSKAPVVWGGSVGQRILGISASKTAGLLGFTAGTSCDDSVALWKYTGDSKAAKALPDERRSTSVVGWLDAQTMLVAAGVCGGPLDLTAVSLKTRTAVPLVFGVDAAASRLPAPTPPPPLPEGIGGSGFA